jgi:lipase maturation factor 1
MYEANLTILAFWQRRRDAARRPRYQLTRSYFLRGMGLVYLSAFSSLAVQLDGLFGSSGILPAAEFLERSGKLLGPGPLRYWRLPTVFWFDASDRALHAVCWSGIALSMALIMGVLPGVCAVLLWLFYLSLVVVGQVFLGYQWDSLLLEAGLLAVLLTPWGVRLSRADDRPWGFAIWLVRLLAVRLMFLSGVVKLASHDPTWRDWTALDYHYQTQPLPIWTGWYVHRMPAWFHGLSLGFMFYAELVAPFFVFGPRPIRLVGFASIVLLQVLIALTGNYGFFNLLAVVICLCNLDDRDWESLSLAWAALTQFGRARLLPGLPSRSARQERRPPRVNLVANVVESVISQVKRRSPPTQGQVSVEDASTPGKAWSWPRRVAVGVVGGVLLATTGSQTLETVVPDFVIPSEIMTLNQWLEPLRSTNTYGLFAVMTTSRPEIVVEGSDDGAAWRTYRFRWKPGATDERPRLAVLHLPRLDWQMWFAALAGDCGRAPWFFRFEQRLLEGSPAVLGLLAENPFTARPPRYVRARLYLYRFAQGGSPDWWSREDRGLFCPPLSLEYFK